MDPKVGSSMADEAHEERSTAHIEQFSTLDLKAEGADEALKALGQWAEPSTPEEERRVLRKIDWRLMPIMIIVNAIQIVDKNTLSAAATYGLIQQANLKGQEYSILVALFYIGYMIAEYPSNYLMQKLPTGKYLTANFVLWGTVLTCSAAATNFPGLAVCRFFLGVFEAPLNPGLIVITSSYWKTEEQARRVGIWYSSAGFINIVVVLIFYGLAHVRAGGMYPYQWMFLVFGLFTVLIGIGLWWALPDSPSSCDFLDERERSVAVQRIRSNQTGVKNREHKRYQVIETIKDPKVWILTLGVFFQNMTNALQSSFTGLIIKGLNYSTYQAVLLTMPAYAVLGVVCLSVTWLLSGKRGKNKRIFALIGCYVPGLVGTAILYAVRVSASNVGLLLFAVYIVNTVSTCASIMYSLLASNIGGYTKKSVTHALFFFSYSLGNIISPQAFRQSEAPRYETGIAVTLASMCANIALFASLYVIYKTSNKRRDREAVDMAELTAEEQLQLAFSDLTDKENKSFRYTL